ncbi:hypothetical protein [Nocardia harenae]|uniref:hypothetical protein n=1 Tax=Nocardia harenae TaxID=358707 RepID=UPI0008315D67|nr:hypothetical protein [Nocardia harenae]
MMGAYSAIPLDASSDGAESVTAISAVPDSAAGESTSIATESAAADPDGTAGTGESVPPSATATRERTLRTTLARGFGWLFFVGGLVGAVLGIAGLHVEITVAGLILACTAGLILLKLRSDSAVREPEA